MQIRTSVQSATLLLATLAATPADAIRRSADGAGDAVLVPYYSVDKGRATLLSLTNHADAPKAVRFVLAEGRNGRPALTFNIYLSARDTWTGAIVPDALGARLLSDDETCTAPAIPPDGVTLRNFAYLGSNNDELGSDIGRLAEGQFEAIEMGELTGNAAVLVQQKRCAGLISRFTSGGIWEANPNTEVVRPTGRLSAHAQLVDVADGIAFDIPSIEFTGFSGSARHGLLGTHYNEVRLTKPTLAPGETRFAVDGDSYIPANRPADAVSLILMAASLEAPFLIDPALDASTDWIVALPTRQAYLDNRGGGELPANTAPIAPFDSATGNGSAPRCNAVTWETIKRNGDVAGTNDLMFPSPVAATLCRNITRLVLSRDLPGPVGSLSTYGEVDARLRLGLRPDIHALGYFTGPGGAFTGALQGLPALAVPLLQARNTNAQPGVLATYGYTGHVVRSQTGFIDF